ncbi:MAG: hypothetical protein LN413_00600 [Candidatus Thermoplasmatota archaeon]|nr:hypothetical protein [Candidatus Thermoplasmatota archaeon]
MTAEELAVLSRLKEEVEKRLYAEAALLAETSMREGLQKRVDGLQGEVERMSAERARLAHDNALLASDIEGVRGASKRALMEAESAGKSRNEAQRLLEEEKEAVVVLGNAIRILNDRVALAEKQVQDILKKAGELVSCAKCGELRAARHTQCFLCGSKRVV